MKIDLNSNELPLISTLLRLHTPIVRCICRQWLFTHGQISSSKSSSCFPQVSDKLNMAKCATSALEVRKKFWLHRNCVCKRYCIWLKQKTTKQKHHVSGQKRKKKPSECYKDFVENIFSLLYKHFVQWLNINIHA